MASCKFLIAWLFALLPVFVVSTCLNITAANIDEILNCCLIEDWLPERNTNNCINQHKFQFTESQTELKMCVHSCYYRSLGVIDEFQVDLSRIQQINSNRSRYEQEAINKAAVTCHNYYALIIERLMHFRTECNSYPYLYGKCIMNEIQMYCHEKLWKESPVCDKFKVKDIC